MNRVGSLVGLVRRFSIFIILGFSVVLNGCATVVMDGGSSVNSASVERDALKEAAAGVSAVNWPKPTSVSMGERLTGIVAGSKDRVTQKEAIAIYVVTLESSADAQGQLVEDAESQLRAADILAAAAESAAGAVRPAMSDVAVVEASISELRQSRDIYLASLEVVSLDKDAERSISRVLKADFNRAIKEIGDAADILADRVANDRTRTMAQPRTQLNFSGSL